MISQEHLNNNFASFMTSNAKADIQHLVIEYLKARGITQKNKDNISEFFEKGIMYHEIITGVDTKEKIILINTLNQIDDNGQLEYFYIPYTAKPKYSNVGNAIELKGIYNENYITNTEDLKELYITDNIFDTLLLETITTSDETHETYKAITIFNDIKSDKNNSIIRFNELISEYKKNLYNTTLNVLVKDRALEQRIIETLKTNNLNYNIQTIPNEYSCFNEFYKKDKIKAIKELSSETTVTDDCISNYYNQFMELLEDNKEREPLKTGFKNLDNVLKGVLPRFIFFRGVK